MMNSAKFVLTLALTVASAASCHKEIAVQGEGSAELTLNPQVDVLTKAPIPGEVFPEGRTIVLSAAYHNGSGSSANFFDGITFKKNGTYWVGMNGTSPNPKYWPVSGSLDLLAYSADGFTNAPTPTYAAKWSESVTLNVSDNSIDQVDILFAGATDRSASGSPLEMQFKHAEAVVAFDAKADVPYDGTKNFGVTINSITLKNVKTNGSVTLNNNGTCSWSDGTAGNVDLTGITLPGGYGVPEDYICNAATAPFGIGGKGILVVPQVLAATSFTVNYTVHYGKDSSSNLLNKNETFTYNIPSSPNWEAGKEYVYQLEFKQDQILVNSTILNWEVMPGDVTVPDKVSATFRDSDHSKTNIDLCSSGIPAKLSANAIVGFAWGDGRYEIIENTTGSEMALATIPHKYSVAPTDSVNIYVRRGTLDFGTLKRDFFNLFHVYNSEEVLLRLLVFTISRGETAHGTFTVTPESNLEGGETITVRASPNNRYFVDKMTYTEEGSATENNIPFSSNVGTFTMPQNDVTVNVTFEYVSLFTINSSNTRVTFAPGNLYYDGTNWGFEAKQYYFRTYNGNGKCDGGGYSSTSGTTSGHWGLFGWVGASSSFTGIAAYGASTSSSTYNYGSVTGEDLKNDWGTILGLLSAPYIGGWRTLTKNEWEWLLGPSSSSIPGTNCRTSSTVSGIANARFLKCKVADVPGLMIFPDAFTWPTDVTAPTASCINKNDLAWSSGPIYTSSQFEKLENAGVVFLPAAANRVEAIVNTVGEYGNYWSSTSNDSIETDAYYLLFSGNVVNPAYSNNRISGRSVRLVSVVQ